MDDGYPWDVGRSDAELDFLDELRELSQHRAHFDAWDYYPQLVVTLTIADLDLREPVILRTLRVDFSANTLAGGNDRAHQIDPLLDPTDPDFFERQGLRPREAAGEAFRWFRQEALRPIERREWRGRDLWRQWVLTEIPEKPLADSGSGRPARPPDQVTRLEPRQI